MQEDILAPRICPNMTLCLTLHVCRALAVSLLHGYSLLHDPDDPEGVPSLVQHTGGQCHSIAVPTAFGGIQLYLRQRNSLCKRSA